MTNIETLSSTTLKPVPGLVKNNDISGKVLCKLFFERNWLKITVVVTVLTAFSVGITHWATKQSLSSPLTSSSLSPKILDPPSLQPVLSTASVVFQPIPNLAPLIQKDSRAPSFFPLQKPTNHPSSFTTNPASRIPFGQPNIYPTFRPSGSHISPSPSILGSSNPLHSPSHAPSRSPSVNPSVRRSFQPTYISATFQPSRLPTSMPHMVNLQSSWVKTEAYVEFKFSNDKNTISGDGNWIAVGDRFNNETGENAGIVIIRKTNVTVQSLYGQNEGDFFGFSVAMSTNALALMIGAWTTDYDADRSGSVYSYYRSNEDEEFQQQHQLNGDAGTDYAFGYSIAMSGNGLLLVVAAPYADINIGSNKNHGSLIFYTRGSIYAVFQPKERIYGECEFQYLGINGVGIEYTNTTILVHAKSRDANDCISDILDNSNNVRSYKLECECANADIACGSYDDYPHLTCA